MNSKIIMYQTEDGLTKIETTFDNDTVWLSIDQMAELFQRDKSTISRHIKNIFNEGELTRNAVVANFATTAAEKIYYSADAGKPYMGMLSFIGDKPKQSDALVAKNYCTEEELLALNSIVSAYLEFAEMQARRRIPMYMSDWIETLDGFLKLSQHEILTHAGKVSAKTAELKAMEEYKKYKDLHLGDVSEVEKDYIKALEDMETKLLGEEDKK